MVLGSHPRKAQPALVSSVAGVSLRAAGVAWRGPGLDTLGRVCPWLRLPPPLQELPEGPKDEPLPENQLLLPKVGSGRPAQYLGPSSPRRSLTLTGQALRPLLLRSDQCVDG